MFPILHRTSISRRFAIGVGIIVVLLLITTVFRIVHPANAYKRLSNEIHDREEKIALANQIGSAVDAMIESMMMLRLTDDNAQKQYLLGVIRNNAKQVTDSLETLRKLARTDRGVHLVADLNNLYHDPSTGVVFLIDTEAKQENTHTLPISSIMNLSTRYHAQLNRLIEFQQSAEYDIKNLASNAMYVAVIYEVVINVVVAVLLLLIALWIIPNINKPIREIARFVRNIGDGKVPEPMTGEWAGEFDEIRKHLNIIGEAISALFTLDRYVLQVGAQNPLSSLDVAIQCHVDWKVRLGTAIRQRETIEEGLAASTTHCHFGKLLQGEIRDRYASLASYPLCVAKHAEFHRHAGRVAQAVNAGKYAEAEEMLENGAYVDASFALSGAIHRIKWEAGQAGLL